MLTSVVSCQELSPRVKKIVLEKPKDFTFLPGQFVMVSIPGHRNANGVLIKKAFSIASAPKADHIELCVAQVPNGMFSPKLCSLTKGEKVDIEGPFGKFFLKEPVEDHTLFVAGGTGIAPLMSMIRTIVSTDPKKPLQLFFGMRTSEDFLYREELELYSNVSITTATSREESDNHGYIQQFLPDLAAIETYICGPPQMVRETQDVLLNQGFSKEQIHKEAW